MAEPSQTSLESNITTGIEAIKSGAKTLEKNAKEVSEILAKFTHITPMELNKLDDNIYGPNNVAYDILNEYNWTLTDYRNGIPWMSLQEFQIDGNYLLTNLKYWVDTIANTVDQNNPNGLNPYNALYKAQPTGTTYIFPWLDSYNHNITQSWGDFLGIEGTNIVNTIFTVFQIAANAPGIAVNTPKTWKGVSPATVPYEITLFNTGLRNNFESYQHIKKNKQLVNRLIMSSLHDQEHSILARPPSIFILTIPGVRYSPACCLTNLTVENIGTLVYKDVDEGKTDIVPEAYKIKFQITELIPESRQIFDALNKGTPQVVSAIKYDDPSTQGPTQ